MGRRRIPGKSVKISPPARGRYRGGLKINQLSLKYNIKDLEERRRKLRNNMTHAEVLLWNYIRRKQIQNIRFRRQFSIELFIVDFYSPQIKLAIEIDGYTHLTEEEIKYDYWRQNKLESYGVRFLRFTNEDIYENINEVLRIINYEVEAIFREKRKISS
ncbi:MAG: 5-methyltetrahydrofolate--homocysteine methyltransferase [Chlorobi bacterium OLB5]|nr:MAG: 5-methyltetrahydrofolate--homocysteine methyltransferase [Chlorobi bacterium OLB5]